MRRRFLAAAALAVSALILSCAYGCLLTRKPHLGVDDAEARAALRASTIAFARGNNLFLARGDGSEERLMLTGEEIGRGGAIFMPALAPDRRRLLFFSVIDLDVRESTGRDLSLNILSLEGERPAAGRIGGWKKIRLEQIAPPGRDSRQEIFAAAAAGWSPDGARIALGINGAFPAGGDAVFLMDAQGSPMALHDLGGRDLARVSSISWTPDGSALILGLEGEEGTSGIVARLTLTGDGATGPDLSSTSGGAPPGSLRWMELGRGRYPIQSPDGSRIAAVDESSGQWDLMIMSPEGKELERFVKPPGRALSRPFWSSDGRYLYYYSLASTGPLGVIEITMLRCLDTRSRQVFDLARLG